MFYECYRLHLALHGTFWYRDIIWMFAVFLEGSRKVLWMLWMLCICNRLINLNATAIKSLEQKENILFESEEFTNETWPRLGQKAF